MPHFTTKVRPAGHQIIPALLRTRTSPTIAVNAATSTSLGDVSLATQCRKVLLPHSNRPVPVGCHTCTSSPVSLLFFVRYCKNTIQLCQVILFTVSHADFDYAVEQNRLVTHLTSAFTFPNVIDVKITELSLSRILGPYIVPPDDSSFTISPLG